MTYRAALVGCGLIGSEFSDTSSMTGIWSHAAAYTSCPDTQLVAVCDPDQGKLERCAKRWKVAARFKDLATMLDRQGPEIVSICTPDATHYPLIRQALEHPDVRAVLAEKPLAANLAQAGELASLAARLGKVLAVNYSRRYATGFGELKAIIERGELGKIQAVSGFFTKGTVHNGSHWFDLAHFLIGPVRRVLGIDRLREQDDDPTLDVILEFESGAAGYLHGCDATAYDLFEMDIVASAGRARIVEEGFEIQLYQVEPSPFGAGYKRLARRGEIDPGLPNALSEAVADIVRCLGEQGIPRCSAGDALQALAIGLAARRSAKDGQAVLLKDFR
ncbi:putative oxidoreductase YcjS [mine drainage metagenome]|uniref:Putative oxidoreductase YcjS n=1 Tax=mine drainage metagenome TaxID=410659 RepID=A0A1J5RFD4_9ZZZZ